MLGNVAGAQQVFERWMEWEPDEQALEISFLSLGLALLYLELRYKEVERARTIYERYILNHCQYFEKRNEFIISFLYFS